MSRLGISTGNTANDGLGDTLRSAMGKVNTNFLEIYSSFGDGYNLVSYASTAGISTLAKNLTGNPIITVGGVISSGISSVETVQTTNLTVAGVVTAIQFKGDGSQLTNVSATNPSIEVYDENIFRGVAKGLNFGQNITAGTPDGSGRVLISVASSIAATSALYSNVSGVSTVSITAGYATSSGIATIAQGLTGTPNITVGIVTATSYKGSGANLSGVITSLVAGTNVTITQFAGIATINASGGSVNYAIIAGYSTSSGISTVSQGLTGTPNISVNQVAISSSVSISGVTSFYNDVHFEYDKILNIGDNDELQIFHNGSNSYIDNFSSNSLVIRDNGAGIQLRRYGGGPNAGLMANFNTGAGVELYYDSVLKLQTFQNGVAINDSVGIGSTAGNPPYRLTVSGVGATITSGLVNAIADLTSSVDGYGQVNIRNSRSAPYASGDLVITADVGTDSSNYIDLGINNTGFSTSSWTINGPLDGYLYSSDSNLSIGVAETNKYFSIFAGGTLIENEKVRVTETGVGIGTTNPTDKLTVRGGDLSVGINTSHGVILTSPNGFKYRLVVDDSGNLSTVLVP